MTNATLSCSVMQAIARPRVACPQAPCADHDAAAQSQSDPNLDFVAETIGSRVSAATKLQDVALSWVVGELIIRRPLIHFSTDGNASLARQKIAHR
ncbi:hypothetical protein IG631_24107 [Alternaria alternata]|nr:hypothetical protein IG631_24107 [Alternaria alternata]